ncbi:winged helix-turn-helix domain-containing protein [Sphingomonas cavernae]|uniref:LysR family transcriptional regulator n=1 Tax=Sphingomonas cavernae TaxID=2320861 RepID=A0A418WN74_9SPHN|nr:LysR family transcriptional regulator [Sphingomonas cavernae]RJF91451.1 LysR family transcriptional regulator [Sphingomonas cavernae]
MTGAASTGGTSLKIKAQVMLADEIAMGPGKAALLEAIASEGSISAAGRALGMSYRRTWLLVDTMNRCWRLPLVETAAGGRHGGGARLTDTGALVLAHYRSIEARLAKTRDGPDWAALHDLLRERPEPPRKG